MLAQMQSKTNQLLALYIVSPKKEKLTGRSYTFRKEQLCVEPLIAAGAVKTSPSHHHIYILSILHAGPIVIPHIASNLLSPITLSKI
jgi:hypothetical protein